MIRSFVLAAALAATSAPVFAQGSELTLLQPGLSGGVVVSSTGLAVIGGVLVVGIVGGIGGDTTQSTLSTTSTP